MPQRVDASSVAGEYHNVTSFLKEMIYSLCCEIDNFFMFTITVGAVFIISIDQSLNARIRYQKTLFYMMCTRAWIEKSNFHKIPSIIIDGILFLFLDFAKK